MDLHRLLHRRESDLPVISEEEWAPIAAALRALPEMPAPRDFRLRPEQAERLRRRTWHERLAIPAPLAGGLAAVLALAILAPSFLGGSSPTTVSGPEAGALDATTSDRANNFGAVTLASPRISSPALDPKAVDFCPLPPPSSPDPTATPTPTPTPLMASSPVTPVPTCVPRP